MALSDLVTSLGGSPTGVGIPTMGAAGGLAEAIVNQLGGVASALIKQRAQRTGASGVPVGAMTLGGLGAGALGALGGLAGLGLGEEPGTLEEAGVLERLGLEGDLERTATLWRRTPSGFRAVRELNARHPITGRIAAWTYRGRPLLYSGDLAICRDVSRVARGAAARTGLRFRKRGRRR